MKAPNVNVNVLHTTESHAQPFGELLERPARLSASPSTLSELLDRPMRLSTSRTRYDADELVQS